MKKFQFLDSARGIAVLLVLLVHSGAVSELFGIKTAVAAFGQRGVQLFYEVSAFSLLYSVHTRGEHPGGRFLFGVSSESRPCSISR